MHKNFLHRFFPLQNADPLLRINNLQSSEKSQVRLKKNGDYDYILFCYLFRVFVSLEMQKNMYSVCFAISKIKFELEYVNKHFRKEYFN